MPAIKMGFKNVHNTKQKKNRKIHIVEKGVGNERTD